MRGVVTWPQTHLRQAATPADSQLPDTTARRVGQLLYPECLPARLEVPHGLLRRLEQQLLLARLLHSCKERTALVQHGITGPYSTDSRLERRMGSPFLSSEHGKPAALSSLPPPALSCISLRSEPVVPVPAPVCLLPAPAAPQQQGATSRPLLQEIAAAHTSAGSLRPARPGPTCHSSQWPRSAACLPSASATQQAAGWKTAATIAAASCGWRSTPSRATAVTT